VGDFGGSGAYPPHHPPHPQETTGATGGVDGIAGGVAGGVDGGFHPPPHHPVFPPGGVHWFLSGVTVNEMGPACFFLPPFALRR